MTKWLFLAFVLLIVSLVGFSAASFGSADHSLAKVVVQSDALMNPAPVAASSQSRDDCVNIPGPKAPPVICRNADAAVVPGTGADKNRPARVCIEVDSINKGLALVNDQSLPKGSCVSVKNAPPLGNPNKPLLDGGGSCVDFGSQYNCLSGWDTAAQNYKAFYNNIYAGSLQVTGNELALIANRLTLGSGSNWVELGIVKSNQCAGGTVCLALYTQKAVSGSYDFILEAEGLSNSQWYEIDFGDDGTGDIWWGYKTPSQQNYTWVRGPEDTLGSGLYYADSFEEHVVAYGTSYLTADGYSYTSYPKVWTREHLVLA